MVFLQEQVVIAPNPAGAVGVGLKKNSMGETSIFSR